MNAADGALAADALARKVQRDPSNLPRPERAELFYCLARAFMPPPAGWSVCDWAQPLAGDIAELAVALGLDDAALQAALRAACARWSATALATGEAPDAWLVDYARLFLVPPVAASLNTGLYLEGSLAGSCAQMMRSCYEVAGVAPSDAFHDLPDHVAMQLEFVARLSERAALGDEDAAGMAEEFSREFIWGWGAALERACREAAARVPDAAVFASLTRLARQAVADPALNER